MMPQGPDLELHRPAVSSVGGDVGGRRRLGVAIVAPSLGILGGQAVQARRLLDGWAGDLDVNAWLVPVNPVPPGPLRHATRVKYARTLVTQFTYWPSLVSQLARADVVHVFSASYFSFLLAPMPAFLVARSLGRPVVLNYRSGEAPDHLKRSAVARRVARGCDRVVVPSSFLRDVFEGHGVAARVIPNTVDAAQFAFRPRDPLQPKILSTRNLEAMYNVGCTLRAFRLVQDRYPEATLTVVGGGSQEAALKAEARALHLRHVRFAGQLPPGDVWRAYADADVYLQSPDIDNMPSSVLEAFSSGNPVVSTDAGGIPVIVESGVNGLLAPRNDHDALAAHVIRLLEAPGLAARLTRNARRSCERYRWPAVRSEWLSLYREVSAARSSAPARVRHA